jgi:tetratricopeptide (TPR) repeat protein
VPFVAKFNLGTDFTVEDSEMTNKKTCFVVMGFGNKVDFESGRTLNLDATYQNLIKPAIEEAGLECLRADEITHSGNINVPMYQHILTADVVVADVSTANCNAFYELGVRHALRPSTTIIIAEDKFKFPFDVQQISIRKYKHLGDDIGVTEAKRFTAELKNAVTEILANDPPNDDSPVYTFLHGLRRLKLPDDMNANQEAFRAAVTAAETAVAPDQTHRALMEKVDEAQKTGDFMQAKALLGAIRVMRPDDPYITQRLALVTYKAKYDTPEKEIAALKEACALLWELDPTTSNDTETLGLWGAVHKRLWDKAKDEIALNKAIRSYERGFHLRNDYYNGINFAYLLNIRSAHAVKLANNSTDPSEAAMHRASAIADFVRAQRVREEVLSICKQWLGSDPAPPEGATAEAKEQYLKNKYWVVASMAEAYLGMGQKKEAEETYEQAASFAPESWMVDTTNEQRARLEALITDSPLKYVKADRE